MSDFLKKLRESPTKPAGAYTLAGSGLVVYLKRWTLAERQRVYDTTQDKNRPSLERQAELLVWSLCDEQNRQIAFTPGDLAGIAFGDDADKLVSAALAANGWGADEKKATSPNNSETPPNSSSSTDSPAN